MRLQVVLPFTLGLLVGLLRAAPVQAQWWNPETWFATPAPSRAYSPLEAQSSAAFASERYAFDDHQMFFIDGGHLFTMPLPQGQPTYIRPSADVKAVVSVQGLPFALQNSGEIYVLRETSSGSFDWIFIRGGMTRMAVSGDTLYARDDGGEVWSLPLPPTGSRRLIFQDTGSSGITDFIYQRRGWWMVHQDGTRLPF